MTFHTVDHTSDYTFPPRNRQAMSRSTDEGIDAQDLDASDGETLAGSPKLVARLSLKSPTGTTSPPLLAMTRPEDAVLVSTSPGSQCWHWQQMNSPNAMDALESGERHELEDVRGWSHEPEHVHFGGHDRASDPNKSPEIDNGKLHPPSHSSDGPRRTETINTTITNILDETPRLWARFRGKNRDIPGTIESARNTAKSSALNILLAFIPFAWASHYGWKNDNVTFALCFLGIIPLEHLLEFGGEQMGYYVGRELGGLVAITMDNAVEVALAIVLLKHCELRILQATIVGVVLLHLLLLPGTAFLTGGARVLEQNLHPHTAQLNSSLLTIGVLTILIPTAFFAALDNGSTAVGLVSNATRSKFMQMSHGLAIILLLVYITSRIFVHNPPGEGNGMEPAPGAPPEIHAEEVRLRNERPKVASGFCLLLLVSTIVVLAFTAEMLVKSIEHVRQDGNIQAEWFGLILLPIVSFSADGVVAFLYFIRATPEQPPTLAKARAIDLSVQFTIFWMPFLVLLGWWINKPLILLFDLYEVSITLGAIFLVNYVTADSKTNFAEGFILVAFYFMIALCTWFYPGQESVGEMLTCGNIVEAMATTVTNAAGGS